MVAGMADPDANLPYLLCPRNCQDQRQMLQLFQRLTLPDCLFKPSRIWSRETKKKKSPCLWCVLYTVVNPQMRYTAGTQGRELRKQLHKCEPVNAEIVDYEFYQNHATGEQGWLFVWKNLQCDHAPNFHKFDNIHEGELSAITMGTISQDFV